MFSLKIGIFIRKGWGIEEDSFVAIYSNDCPQISPKITPSLYYKQSISGLLWEYRAARRGALFAVLYKKEHLCC